MKRVFERVAGKGKLARELGKCHIIILIQKIAIGIEPKVKLNREYSDCTLVHGITAVCS